MRYLAGMISALVCAGALCLGAPAALAESKDMGNISGWEIAAYTDTDGFASCMMSRTQVNDVSAPSVGFLVAKNFSYAAIAVSWTNYKVYGQNDELAVTYRVDNHPVSSGTGLILKGNNGFTMRVDQEGLIKKLRDGHYLYIGWQGYDGFKSMVIDLQGTSNAFTATGQCVINQGASLRQASNTTNTGADDAPADSGGGMAFTAAQAPGMRAENTTVLANVLSEAGVPGFRIAPLDHEAKTYDDTSVRWYAKGMSGDVFIVLLDQASAVQGAAMSADAQSCKGKFVSGILPADPAAGRALETFSECSEHPGMKVSHTIVPRAAGGFYVFTVYGMPSVNDAGSDEEAAEHATDGIRQAAYQITTSK